MRATVQSCVTDRKRAVALAGATGNAVRSVRTDGTVLERAMDVGSVAVCPRAGAWHLASRRNWDFGHLLSQVKQVAYHRSHLLLENSHSFSLGGSTFIFFFLHTNSFLFVVVCLFAVAVTESDA